MPKGKVLVVDCEERVRQSVGNALSERGYRVILATSGEECLEVALQETPDAVVLAAELQDLSGVETCRELRKWLMCPIVLISAHNQETDVVLGLGVGADVYLAKPVRIAEVLAYIDAAIRRETQYRRERCVADILNISDLILDLRAHELRRNGSTIPLTPTEFRLVEVLARNAGHVVTRDKLLDEVWQIRSDGVYSRTVDVHVGRIRRKIGDDPTEQHYIITIPGIGYKMPRD